jgi:hypothetical protein
VPDSRPKPKPKRPPPPSTGTLELSDGLVTNASAEEQLAEVENALSLLGGRHPEFVRAEREKAEATARRRRELELASVRARRRALRAVVIGTVVAAVAGVGLWFARQRYEARRQALEGSSAPAKGFAALGFTEPSRPAWGRSDRLEVPLAAGSCAIALGADRGKPIAIEVVHDGETLAAQGSFGFCTCADETVTVSATSGDPARRSVRLLRADAREFGSVLGFSRHALKPAKIHPCACTEDQLDGWLTSANEVLGPPDAAWQRAGARGDALAAGGLRALHSVAAPNPLVPVLVPAGRCEVVVAAAANDTLALRVRGGGRPLEAARGPLAACSKTARAFGVWHEGSSAITILDGEAARVGGRLELGDSLDGAGLAGARTWIEPDDLDWDAALAIGSAQISGAQRAEIDDAAKLPADAKVVAFSMTPGGRLEPTQGEFACDRAGDGLTWLCAQAALEPWHEATGKARVGMAFAPLPLWMKPLSGILDANRTVLALTHLARTLAHRGFEATALESVTESDYGAAVLGRAGEDAIVAITLQPAPPYALPLSDGHPWTLDGEPGVIALGPGRRIALRGRVPPSGSADVRRTVVFRRAVAATAPTK